MRIAVNTRFLLHNQLEGIGTFSHQVLSRLVKQHPEHEFIFIFDRPWNEEFIYADNVIPVAAFPQARHPFLFYWWFEWSLPRVFKKMKADIFFSPDGYLSLRANLPQYPVFHDLAFEHYPDDVPKLASIHYRHYFPRYANKAKRLLTVSEFSKKDIVEQYGVQTDKIDVVYNGADELYGPISPADKAKVQETHGKGQAFFLYVGALHQRKNITRLLKAYSSYLSACGTRNESPKHLVIVGRKAWGTSEMEQAYEADSSLEDHVHFTGRLSLEELSQVMASAFCHVNVSYFEGFGIPILESMKCGVPIITSSNSPMEEVAGAAAITIDPFDTNSISMALERMHFEEGLRDSKASKCEQEAGTFFMAANCQLCLESTDEGFITKSRTLKENQMGKIALYPGSFDPITLGHTDVIERCVPMFDKIYVGLGTNTSKKYLYSLEERKAMLEEVYKDHPSVEVVSFSGLTVSLCKEIGSNIIVRGVRSTTDMEYERAIAESNQKLFPEVETLLLFSSPQVSSISSSIVRELIRNKADISGFVPRQLINMIYQ